MVISIISMVSCVFITALLIVVLNPIAHKIDLIDIPSDRKHHLHSVPLVGGISMAVGFLLSIVLIPISLQPYRELLFGIGILLIVGVLDDHLNLSAIWKFTAQILVGLFLTLAGHTVVTSIGNVLGSEVQNLGFLAVPFTILGIVGVINAINMIDGHDGIAGLMTGLTFFGLAVMCYLAGELNYLRLLLVIGSAITVFLIFNLPLLTSPKHQVFMGDAGAMFLGLLVAFFLIRMTQQQFPVIKPTVAIWFIGLPLLDMMAVIVRRLVRRKTLTSADRTHIHHLLMKVGLSKWSIIVVLGLTQAGFIFIGIVGHIQEISDQVLFWTPFAVLLVYMVLLSVIERRGKHRVTS